MEITQQDGSEERTILIGMIVDNTVCGRICSRWTREGLFRSRWSNLIASWCIKHFERYDKAPGKKIEDIFDRWVQKSKDKATIDLVEDFLAGLSDEWRELKKDSNSEYVLDLAGKHFALVQAEQFREDLDNAIIDKDPDKAVEMISSFNRINIGVGEWINPFQDRTAIKSAFESNQESIIRYPGALGKFFDTHLCRDGLICIEGPEKRGKTFWLMDMVFRAAEQRRRVAYFQVGDMSRDQIMKRLMVRLAGIPANTKVIEYPERIKLWDEMNEKNQKIRKGRAITKKRKFTEPLGWRSALKACDEFQKKRMRSVEDYLRLSVYPIETVSVPDIKSLLTEWSRDGWVVDVVVIDYSDILRMDYGGLEGRDRINQTWKDLRNISQVFHCLVITASQSDAKGGEARTLGRSHFSEDKRKRAYVTGTIGLNQVEQEKETNLMRLNWIVLREGKYIESKCVWVAGCPQIANFALRSKF